MTTWLEHFSYRGRPPGSNDPAGWHVEIGVTVPDGLGGEHSFTKIITPEEAASFGFPLEKILPAINQSALEEADRLRTQVVGLEADVAFLRAELDRVKMEARAAAPPPSPDILDLVAMGDRPAIPAQKEGL